jgi:hypothetical protein
MRADIPDETRRADRRRILRHSWRHDGLARFSFINNYQRRRRQARHQGVSLVAPIPEGPAFPELTVEDGEYFFLPFNMRVGNALLTTSLATPLCVLSGSKPLYIFYAASRQAEAFLERERRRPLSIEGGEWPTDARYDVTREEARTPGRRRSLVIKRLRL